MLIRAGYEIEFDLPQPAEVITHLNVLAEHVPQLRTPDQMQVWANGLPQMQMQSFHDRFGNLSNRLSAPAGRLRLYNDFVIADSGLPRQWPETARQHEVCELPNEHMVFLMPSRYCEVDKLSATAWQLFGHTALGWQRVKAICDWVHGNISFGYQYACNTSTANDVFESRRGVCRDFAHLAITFCRAMNIPARYATGYLGDIGVPFNPAPMDFSACFEVYMGGRWHLLDARHNQRRIGWILMARGRDAADCAITTSFGTANLVKFQVWTREVQSDSLTLLPQGSGSVQQMSSAPPSWSEPQRALGVYG